MHQTPAPRKITSSIATVVRRSSGTCRILGLGLLLAVSAVTHAADTPITWGFSPTPTAVRISVGDTVTWNGDFVFHPVAITDATFSTLGATVSTAGPPSYTRAFPSPGVYFFMCANHFSSMPTTVTVCAPPPPSLAALDIDGDGQVDATTDGLLVLRYLLGLRNDALIAGAVATCATRSSFTDIQNYLALKVVP